MPRGEGNWSAFFKRREGKKKVAERSRSLGITPVPRVVWEPVAGELKYPKSNISRFAENNRRNPTPAEREFEKILLGLNHGSLKEKFKSQYPVSGKWIVDYYFPEIRLAVEIDGSIHLTSSQIKRDRLKDADCARFDITLIRFTNSEVFGDRDALVEKLREGWREAKRRPNSIIGTKIPL